MSSPGTSTSRTRGRSSTSWSSRSRTSAGATLFATSSSACATAAKSSSTADSRPAGTRLQHRPHPRRCQRRGPRERLRLLRALRAGPRRRPWPSSRARRPRHRLQRLRGHRGLQGPRRAIQKYLKTSVYATPISAVPHGDSCSASAGSGSTATPPRPSAGASVLVQPRGCFVYNWGSLPFTYEVLLRREPRVSSRLCPRRAAALDVGRTLQGEEGPPGGQRPPAGPVEADRDTPELVLFAVAQNGAAYASDRLKDDPDVVLAAVQQNGAALQYASAASRKAPGSSRPPATEDPAADEDGVQFPKEVLGDRGPMEAHALSVRRFAAGWRRRRAGARRATGRARQAGVRRGGTARRSAAAGGRPSW